MNRRQWTIVVLLATAAGFLGGLLAGGAGEEPAGAAIDPATMRKVYQPTFYEWLSLWGQAAWGSVEPGKYEIAVRVEHEAAGRGPCTVKLYCRCAPDARAALDAQLTKTRESIRGQIRFWNARGYTSISEDDFQVQIGALPRQANMPFRPAR